VQRDAFSPLPEKSDFEESKKCILQTVLKSNLMRLWTTPRRIRWRSGWPGMFDRACFSTVGCGFEWPESPNFNDVKRSTKDC